VQTVCLRCIYGVLCPVGCKHMYAPKCCTQPRSVGGGWGSCGYPSHPLPRSMTQRPLLPTQVVIFVKSVQRANVLNQLLNECNFPSVCIHRGMDQVRARCLRQGLRGHGLQST